MIYLKVRQVRVHDSRAVTLTVCTVYCTKCIVYMYVNDM